MSRYLEEARRREFCGACEAGVPHSRERCDRIDEPEGQP